MASLKNPDIINQIEEALSEIRPYLNDDGGDIELIEVTEEMIVKVRLVVACITCEISMQTLKNGVEASIKKAVPEIQKVIEVAG